MIVGWASIPLAFGCAGEPGDRGAWSGYARIVAVEDARGERSPEPLSALAVDPDPRVRAWAVRGLGRLGDPALAARVVRALEDPDPRVRIEAAHALAALGEGRGLLRAGAEDPEEDPRVRAAFVHAFVRSAVTVEELTAADTVLRRLGGEPALQGPDEGAAAARLTLARAWDLRARTAAEGWDGRLAVPALLALADAARADAPPRVLRLVLAALRTRGEFTAELLDAALRHPDPGVRREAVATLGALPRSPAPRSLAPDRIVSFLRDPDVVVRLEALQSYQRFLREEEGCDPVFAAVEDPHPHVALAALDLLAAPCPEVEAQRRLLLQAVDEGGGVDAGGVAPGPGAAGWHRAAHALAALAAVAPGDARARLEDAANHPSPFFRARVARAAARVPDEALLRSLAADPDANVRTAAVRGLPDVAGHGADAVYREELGSSDPQLVLAAVAALEGTPEPASAAEAMAAALLRFTATRKETVRDVRMALLDGLEAAGGVDPDRLRPLLEDYDPVVAGRAAELLVSRTGEEVEASPRPLPRLPTPDATELETLARATVVLEMARGGEIAIRLRPDLAATNAARFARLAREGRYDGLTFHRVEPNFVIQGGSPGANEYAGADLYTRDELGRASHRAGTVGLSTRGPDTGDAQFFVNLVDNPRLDFAYTVFGEVVDGMDVARSVLEGDVIRRARVDVDER